MPFPKHLLADHEKVVFDLKPHWVALLPPVLWTLLLAAGGSFVTNFASDQIDEPTYVDNAVGVAFLIAWYFLAGLPALRWGFTHFVLTTDRLITRTGVISKHSKEIPLERINDITFTQSVIERVLGAGDLMLESAGERGQNRITNVRKPEQVQLMIYKETEQNNARMERGQIGGSIGDRDAAPESLTAQLEALGRLNKQGVISDAEFEAKKKDLLDRM